MVFSKPQEDIHFLNQVLGLFDPFEQVPFHLAGLHRRISPHEGIFGAEQAQQETQRTTPHLLAAL